MPGLAQHVVGRNAAFSRHPLLCIAVSRHKIIPTLGRWRIGIDGLRRLRGAATPCAAITCSTCTAGIAPGIATQTQCGWHGNVGLIGSRNTHAARQLPADGVAQPTRLPGHGNRELLVQQIGAEIALCAVQQTGLHRRLAHAFDHLAHEQRLQLLGCFAHRLRVVLARCSFQSIERTCIHRQRIASGQ